MTRATGEAPADGTSRTERTRRRLVRATREELAESGSFTAERVAARAGLSPATFYVYFPTKDDALVGAFAGVLDDLVAFVEETFAIERLLDEGLEPWCRNMARGASAFFGRHALTFRVALARLPESRELRDTWREHERIVFARYRRFLELGQQAGRVRAGALDPLARALLVLTQGLNNPILLGRRARDPVFSEIGRSLCALLTPDDEPAA